MTINDRFFLKGTDVPFITALKFIAKPQYEVLIYVRDNPEMPYKEGAKQFGIPVGTFKTRLHRARQKILEWRRLEAQKPLLNNIEAP